MLYFRNVPAHKWDLDLVISAFADVFNPTDNKSSVHMVLSTKQDMNFLLFFIIIIFFQMAQAMIRKCTLTWGVSKSLCYSDNVRIIDDWVSNTAS